jgi:hypothetical protein
MKKMIPVYLLQIAMLATVFFVGHQLVNELRSMKAEIKTELSNAKVEPYTPLKQLGPGDQAVRVVIVR